MTPAEAAWVRKHAWNGIIRAEYKRAPDVMLLCGCQHGPSRWCQDGQHGGCHRECPHASAEAWVWTRRGHVAQFAEPYQHPYPWKPGRRPKQPDAWAQLWLADRVCRWVCSCPCHAPEPPRPVTYEAVALPGLELIGATT